MLGQSQRRFFERAYQPAVAPPAGSRLVRLLRRFELHRVEAVARLLPPGGYLLDVGCGSGELVVRAHASFAKVVGVDLAMVQLRAARARAAGSAPRPGFVMANLDAGLPFGPDAFDVITAVALLALVYDPFAAVRELVRVLKPGGYLAVEVPNLAYLPRRLALLSGKLPRVSRGYGWDGGHLHNFTQAALRDLLRQQHLTVLMSSGSGVFAALRTWRPSLLTGNLIMLSRKDR